MTITCAIIDDEPLAVDLLKSYVDNVPFLKLVGSFNNAVSAISAFSVDAPDLIFLDIQMPDLNGLEFSRIIGQRSRIVFTTAFDKYALESYKVKALDYLLKPISYADFLNAVAKAKEWFDLVNKESAIVSSDGVAEGGRTALMSPKVKNYILIKSDYKLMQVCLDRILYIEGLKDYVKVVMEDDPKPIMTLMSMKVLEDQLPAERFVRVHRSFIVQPCKIRVIERNRIVFGKVSIPISESYKDKFQDFMQNNAMLGYRIYSQDGK